MIKMMTAIRRKPGMTQQEYFAYIRDVHGELSRANPLDLRRYVQNHVFDSAYGVATDSGYDIPFHRDSVTELYFDNIDSMAATFTNKYVLEVIAPDGLNFNDILNPLALVARDEELRVPDPGSGPVKYMYFLRKPDDVALDVFVNLVRTAHEKAIVEATGVRRAVASFEAPEASSLAQFFGTGEGQPYGAVLNLWFDEGETLPSFRAYQAALLAQAGADAAVFVASQSFFLLAREVEII